MFYEDFSNPKYISDNCQWVFPYSENFYLKGSKLFYESRIIPLNKPFSGTPNFMIVIPSSEVDLTNTIQSKAKIKITMFGEGVPNISYHISPLFTGKGTFDYYKISGYDVERATSYKVEIIDLGINSIKIYGL